jgi:hypothetical protein
MQRQGGLRRCCPRKVNLEAHQLIEIYQRIVGIGWLREPNAGAGGWMGGAVQASPCTLKSAPLPLFRIGKGKPHEDP